MSAWTVRQTDSRIEFSTPTVVLTWDRNEKGLAFAGLKDVRSGRGFAFGAGTPLWRVELRDPRGFATKLNGTAAEGFGWSVAEHTLTLTWSDAEEGVAVTLTVRADDDRPVTRWRLAVADSRGDRTIREIVFPSLGDAIGPSGSHRQDVLVTPEGFGLATPDPIRRERLSVWSPESYPSGNRTMAFTALLNDGLGLYVGSHDPSAAGRRVTLNPDRPADRLGLDLAMTPPGVGGSQGRVALEYDTVLGLFEGDWYDAAEMYRPWAQKQAWASRTVAEREETPQWARSVPLWLRLGISNEPSTDSETVEARVATALRFREAFGRDIAAHVYCWHGHPFDAMYPDYPPRPGIREALAALQAGGVHAMPYINGRLFDPDNPDWDRQDARRWAVKTAGAKWGANPAFLSPETYGSGAVFAPMCPATGYWQDKIADVIERIVAELGVDGVYIDQIAAAGPKPCADAGHGHAPGDGGWWVEGYRAMIEQTRRKLQELGRGPVLLTTECNAEPYLDFIDGFLMWHSRRNFVVPLFPAVYGGRGLLFGRSASAANRPAFRLGAAQNVLWGCQMGWFELSDAEHLMTDAGRREMNFLRCLAELYQRLTPMLHGGRMLRPPRLAGPVRRARVTWRFFNAEWPETVPWVQTARWRKGSGELVAVANAHTRSQTVELAEPLAPQGRAEWMGGRAGEVRPGRRPAIEMPPLSAVVLAVAG